MKILFILLLALGFPPGSGAFTVDTKGGSGAEVYRVNNLNGGAGGNGSLLRCLEASGPRVCVFDISGVINLGYDVYVKHGNLTVAGQTAPWPGVAIQNGSIQIAASDVVIQHITFMRGDGVSSEGDSLGVSGSSKNPKGVAERIIIDHCSFYWATDEALGLFSAIIRDVVISNSIFAETLLPSNAGMLIGAGAYNVALVNNLFISMNHRNPGFANNTKIFIAGNLVYNYRNRAMQTEPGGKTEPAVATIVDNVVIYGPDTVETQYFLDIKSGTAKGSAIYLSGNAHPLGTDQWALVTNNSPHDVKAGRHLVWYDDYKRVNPADLEAYITANVGSRPRLRSDLDNRIIAELGARGGSIKDCMTGCANAVGGWPVFPVNISEVNMPANLYGDVDGNGRNDLEDWLDQQESLQI